MASIEDYRTNIHQLNKLISCSQHELDAIKNENRLIKESLSGAEKTLEMFKLKVDDLSTENSQLTKLVYTKIESGPEQIFHSTAFGGLNDVVRISDEKAFSWTKICKAFGKTPR